MSIASIKAATADLLTPAVRRWAYGVSTAVLGVFLVYGLVTADKVAAWAGLFAAVTGMAGAFVDETATPRHAADDDATRP